MKGEKEDDLGQLEEKVEVEFEQERSKAQMQGEEFLPKGRWKSCGWR